MQIVDIVDEHIIELVDGGIDVPRHGDIHEEDRPLAPGGQQSLRLLFRYDKMGRAGRADDDVGFFQVVEYLVKVNRNAVKG